MRRLRMILLAILTLLILALLVGAAFAWDLTRGMLPQHSGELRLSGLDDRVEIIRDANGIPHIYASTPHDLFFAQGYTHAQDRWWQMEFFRHTGNGTLQELTGKTDSLMGTDVFIRTVGWRRAAERELANYDPDVLAIIQAFSDGVNAYILNRAPGDLALEYGVLGLTGVNIPVEAWTPADTLVWAKVMQWDLGGDSDGERYRDAVINAVGMNLWQDYAQPFAATGFPTIVQPEDYAAASAFVGTRRAASAPATQGDVIVGAGGVPLDTAFAFGAGDGIGSNNWVVSGNLTASGRPLLANDPHLGVQMPSIWYEIGLHCTPVTDACPYDVQGYAFSPAPAVIIGHNANIAWGVTNVGPDTQDLYRIEVNPADELQYRWNGEWVDFTIYEETLNFGDGEAPITLRVRETVVGPIINDNQIDNETGEILGFNNDNPLALRWTSLDGGTLFESVEAINRAANWDDFRAALRLWDSPSQNFIYADIEGNIGYQMPSNIPIRAVGETGNLPTICAEDACAWQGYIPFDLLPSVYNPERGYIATANQPVVPDDYYDLIAAELGGEAEQYLFGRDFDIGYRGARIVEMLEATNAHTPQTFAAIQGDNKLIVAESFAPYLRDLAIDEGDLAALRDWMLEWDYQLDMDSSRAALWMLFFERLTDNTLNDELAGADEAANGTADELFALEVMATDVDNVWWDDVSSTDVVEDRDVILLRALTEAASAAREQLGADREAWRWGALHTTTFVSNPLGASGIDLIEGIVNRGPVATSGGRTSPNATGWGFAVRGFGVGSAPSMRMILDVGAFENSLSINPTGQSGHPFSSHYDNMIDDWRNIGYHGIAWTREGVGAAGVATLVLLPQ
jgi:penicillin G amidase